MFFGFLIYPLKRRIVHIIILYDFRLDVVRRVLQGKKYVCVCVCEEKKKTRKNIVLGVM
jgi:hypothetical protein